MLLDYQKIFRKQELPTVLRVIRFYNLVSAEKKIELQGKNPSVSDIADIVVKQLKSIWARASIQMVSDTRLQELVIKENLFVKNLNKSYNAHQKKFYGVPKMTRCL